MPSLKSMVASLIANPAISPATSDSLRVLLRYPLTVTKFDFTISQTELDEFYLFSLYRLIHYIFFSPDHETNQPNIDLLDWATLHAKPDVMFQFLVDQFSVTRSSSLCIVIKQLEKFLFEFDRLHALFVEWISSTICPRGSFKIFENLVRSLVTIPNCCANASQGHIETQLNNRNSFVHKILSAFSPDKLVDVHYAELYGLILSQLALSGYGDECTSFLLHATQRHASMCSTFEPFLWSSVLSFAKDSCLELLVVPILRHSNHPHLSALLLSTCLMSSKFGKQKVLMHLFRRLLFVRYFPSGWLLRNIFGSLAEILTSHCPEDEKKPFFEMINDHLGLPTLRLWADSTAIQLTSVEQRVYVSQALASWITDFYTPTTPILLKIPDSILLPDILTGISNHLSSPRPEIRVIGMAVGQWLMEVIKFPLDAKPNDRLEFKFVETEEIKRIKPFFVHYGPFTNKTCEKTENQSTLICDQQVFRDAQDTKSHSDSNLDSDDDPEESQSLLNRLPQRPGRRKTLSSILPGTRKPKYLRECLDGLLLTKPEDNHISLTCFASIADLVYAHPRAARELSTELVRALVHLECPACPDESQLLANRHSALVAVGTVAPKECARCLTYEFYQPTCSLAQRHNIISAITDIACNLSSGVPVNLSSLEKSLPKSLTTSKLEAQTRRFSTPTAPKAQTINRFAQVAGEFFFPLLHGLPQLYSSSQTGVFAHQDAGLLSSLVALLATVYACARGSVSQARMASELLDIMPGLYRHSEPAVRRAVLLAVGTVIAATPTGIFCGDPQLFFGNLLMSESSSDSTSNVPSNSVPAWLKRCSMDDADSDCQRLATAGLVALCDRMHELSLF